MEFHSCKKDLKTLGSRNTDDVGHETGQSDRADWSCAVDKLVKPLKCVHLT